jgi:hypothetical protein
LIGQSYDILDVNDYQTFQIAAGARSGASVVADINNEVLKALIADRDGSRFEAFAGPGWNQAHLRTRTKGQDSFLQIDSQPNGSNLNSLLGLPAGGALDFGETIPFVKRTGEVLTIVYEFNYNNSTLFTAGAL